MMKQVTIDGKTFPISTSLSWVGVYRNQFDVDPLTIFIPLAQVAVSLVMDGETLDAEKVADALYTFKFQDVLNLTWALAKNADRTIASPDEWLMQFDSFPLDEVVPEIGQMLLSSLVSKKKYEDLKKWMEKKAKNR